MNGRKWWFALKRTISEVQDRFSKELGLEIKKRSDMEV